MNSEECWQIVILLKECEMHKSSGGQYSKKKVAYLTVQLQFLYNFYFGRRVQYEMWHFIV